MIDLSIKVVRKSGGGCQSPNIKIGYSKPRGAESREGSSTVAESSWVT